eukprot:TRINITY_DN8755_c0_g1_i1.p1 TRINITY_DN8755_c0_g1~~TRINITY_DN8755_c0_g1_i1.p1  ORF type:complete len:184 (+),score=40.23 TRINITY_DN8755_c0_g1_i1:38-589(+)
MSNNSPSHLSPTTDKTADKKPVLSPSKSPRKAKNSEETAEERALRISAGFKLNSMQLRDADSGDMLWKANFTEEIFTTEQTAKIPSTVLDCRAVSREISFYSRETIKGFHIKQHVLMEGAILEEWDVWFGFVMPNSTNSWQTTFYSSPQKIPAEMISGKVVIETSFFDGNEFLSTSKVRVFYT